MGGGGGGSGGAAAAAIALVLFGSTGALFGAWVGAVHSKLAVRPRTKGAAMAALLTSLVALWRLWRSRPKTTLAAQSTAGAAAGAATGSAAGGPVRVLMYVQHVRGIGHFQRTRAIARALAAPGGGRQAQVTVVTGGPPLPLSLET
eukprot:SAG22_NODE_1272_length_4923_cov_3.681385_7_plen_145_part_01